MDLQANGEELIHHFVSHCPESELRLPGECVTMLTATYSF